jgi:hypothetical protein
VLTWSLAASRLAGRLFGAGHLNELNWQWVMTTSASKFLKNAGSSGYETPDTEACRSHLRLVYLMGCTWQACACHSSSTCCQAAVTRPASSHLHHPPNRFPNPPMYTSHSSSASESRGHPASLSLISLRSSCELLVAPKPLSPHQAPAAASRIMGMPMVIHRRVIHEKAHAALSECTHAHIVGGGRGHSTPAPPPANAMCATSELQ